MSSILVLGYNVNMSEKSIDTNTLWLLWEFVSAIKPKFIRIAEQHGITLQQLHLLSALDREIPTPMSKLAVGLACDASNVTGLVDRLSNTGFAKRVECETDRRIKMVLLTEEGASMQKLIKEDFFKSCRSAIEDELTLEELESFQSILHKLLQANQLHDVK